VESDNGVGKVSVQTHAWCTGNRHVGEETHGKSRQGGDGSSRSDKIAVDLLNTLHVFDVGHAEILHAFGRADASATSLTDDCGIDRDDVSHGEEGS
jgi:hypothetical protein